ncbi:MAG: CcmD family protein [Deltaproteobacteria bacterium]|nr:CcmD family protein [Deltaproteobacteria bacterium]
MKEGLGFVMAVNLIIWCGIAVYLFVLDRRIKRLEND